MYEMITRVILNLCAGTILRLMEVTRQNSEKQTSSRSLKTEEDVLRSVLVPPQLAFCHLFHTGLQ